jgi:hypothetical protein
MKERLRKEYTRRLRVVLKYELTAENKIRAVPILKYGFGSINWGVYKIQKVERKTRKILTVYTMHH